MNRAAEPYNYHNMLEDIWLCLEYYGKNMNEKKNKEVASYEMHFICIFFVFTYKYDRK